MGTAPSRPSPCAPAIYRRRDAQSTPLYRLVEDRYEAVKGEWEERFESRFGLWRGFVDGAIARYLDCGILENGFARWDAEAIGPRLVYSNDAIKKGKPQIAFDGTEYIVTWPEAKDSSFVFNTRRIDRDVAEDVGPVLTLARGPLIGSVRPPLLNDWSYVSAPIPAVVYGRADEVDGLLWYERLFLQEAFSDRHRVVSH